MIASEIRIDSKNATDSINKFINKKVGEKLAKEINKQLVQGMKSRAPFWKGHLRKSIQGYKTRNGYNIHMNFYGSLFEEGHFIPPTPIPYLYNWAFSKLGGRGFYFINHQVAFGHRVLPGGHKQKKFIQPSIDDIERNIDTICVKIINKSLRESGFK